MEGAGDRMELHLSIAYVLHMGILEKANLIL